MKVVQVNAVNGIRSTGRIVTELIYEYANKAWECGRRNHQIKEIQSNLYKDLKSLVEEDKNEGITN